MFAIQMDRKWHYLRYIFTSFARIQKKKKGLIRLLMADIKHQTTWLFGFIVVVIFFVSVQLFDLLIFV